MLQPRPASLDGPHSPPWWLCTQAPGAATLHVPAGTQPLALQDSPARWPQVHAACLALLLATNPAACAMPYATAGRGRAHVGQVADALARGLKHVWMPLSPERLRFG